MRYVRSAATAAAALALTAAGAVVPAATSSGAAEAAREPLPTRLTHLGTSQQVIVVTSASWTSSRARLQAWQLTTSGDWVRTTDPVPARVGWNGMRRAANRLQSTGTTPAGTFGLLRGFGLVRPQGVDLPYQRVDDNDWWPYDPSDPKTYNVMQPHRVSHARWRTDWAERLKSYRSQYRYAVVLDYNLPSGIHWRNGQRVASTTANTSAGGGIFLHVNGDGATAGCISVERAQMRQLLTWLDPALDPVIVIGPRDVIERM